MSDSGNSDCLKTDSTILAERSFADFAIEVNQIIFRSSRSFGSSFLSVVTILLLVLVGSVRTEFGRQRTCPLEVFKKADSLDAEAEVILKRADLACICAS